MASTPGKVSGLDAHAGFWLRFVSNHVSGRFRRRVEENGVTVSEWVALRELYEHEPATTASLMDALGLTKGAVSKVLGRLERRKLARRLPDPKDRRAQRVALTRAGRALVPRLAALADENDEFYFGKLTPESRAELVAILRELVRVHGLTEVPTE